MHQQLFPDDVSPHPWSLVVELDRQVINDLECEIVGDFVHVEASSASPGSGICGVCNADGKRGEEVDVWACSISGGICRGRGAMAPGRQRPPGSMRERQSQSLRVHPSEFGWHSSDS